MCAHEPENLWQHRTIPAYGLIAEKLFRSETMLENMPDSALIFEPLRIVLVYALYFLGRHLAKKRNA